ncbi:YaiI/YqxD family protein [Bacillus massilinigeriensis]|uniref:YaiI/YqxD family protein n=1 Tax=Bacillus mediterraneensis TaxID=1805474 RepID=UPI0008F812B1|nr:YaiI/YqxD family protein [Bacillus mediterraneensis]
MDADSCPVKKEIVELSSRYKVPVVFVASYDHMLNDESVGKWVYVDPGSDAADLYIMNHALRGDLAVTQDIGLASALLGKGVYVLSPRGMEYQEDKIPMMLEIRHYSARLRRKGHFGKGPKAFSQDDRERFVKELAKHLSTSD